MQQSVIDAVQRGYGDGTCSEEEVALIVRVVEEGVKSWPQLLVECEQETFAFFLGERLSSLSPEDHVSTWVDGLVSSDLYLALAASLGGEVATQCVVDAYHADIRAVANKFARSGLSSDEAYQMLLTHLLVPRTTGDEPKILRYSGKGLLKNWIRVTSTRLFIDMLRKQNKLQERNLSLDSEAVFDEPVAHQDLELDFLKSKYRAEFKMAFSKAVKELSSYQRNLLRQHHIGGLTLDRLATLHHVHRATIARHLAEARGLLLEHTRKFMMDELVINSGEFESMMQLIASKLEVSFSKLLHSTHHHV